MVVEEHEVARETPVIPVHIEFRKFETQLLKLNPDILNMGYGSRDLAKSHQKVLLPRRTVKTGFIGPFDSSVLFQLTPCTLAYFYFTKEILT